MHVVAKLGGSIHAKKAVLISLHHREHSGAGGDRAALAQWPRAGMTIRKGRVLENTPGPGSLLAPNLAARPWGAAALPPSSQDTWTDPLCAPPRPWPPSSLAPPTSRPLPPQGVPPLGSHLTAAFPCPSQHLAQNRGAGEPLLGSPSPHPDDAPPSRQGSQPPSPWRGPKR